MRFLIVCVGRNCEPWALRSMQSIAEQRHHDVDVFVIDDASTDGTGEIVADFCTDAGWRYRINDESVGAMRNQYDAWTGLDGRPGDVVVWVDLDDRLAHPDALEVVAQRYVDGALLTYGSYAPDPPSATCPSVLAYPQQVVRRGLVRQFTLRNGIRFNHLRTVSWDVMRHISVKDCQTRKGEWFKAGPDCAVMIPALELAGTRHAVIDEVLYLYTSDNEFSEWRRWPTEVNVAHRDVLTRQPRRALARR